jgi:PST family polysaccharide transporter
MEKDIKHLAIKGLAWNFISEGTAQIFRFIVTLFLARLLLPEEFGVMGMASIFIGLISTFNELGLTAAIIQRKDVTNDHLTTSFSVGLIVGVGVCLLIIASAPFISDFFHEPRLEQMLFVLSFIFLISPFYFVNIALLSKQLNFRSLALVNIASEIISGTLAILLALNGFGAWSLVWKIVLSNVMIAFGAWIVCPWRPSLQFNISRFKELSSFSFNYVSSKMINYVQGNVDNITVGRFLGAVSLGYYSIAYQLITFPFRRISVLISNVTFPTFSAIKDEQERLCSGYLKVVAYVSIITLPMLAGLFMLAPEFVTIVLGEKWVPAILPIRILAIAGVAMALANPTDSVLLAKGRSDIQLRLNIATLILLTIAVWLMAGYGISAVAAAVALVAVLVNFYILAVTNKLLKIHYRKYWDAVCPALMASFAMLTLIFAVKQLMVSWNMPEILILICCTLIGAVVYCVILLKRAKYLKDEALSIIKKFTVNPK